MSRFATFVLLLLAILCRKLRRLPAGQSGGLAERQADLRHLSFRSYWAGTLLCLAPALIRRQRAHRYSFPRRPAPFGRLMAKAGPR